MTQEFDAQQDSWIEIAAALDRYPFVIVRRGVDPVLLQALLQDAKAEYARRDAQHSAGILPPDKQGMHLKVRAIGIGELAVNGVSAPELLMTPLVSAAAALVLRKAPAIAFSSFRCARIGDKNLTLPYHQDSRIVALLAPQRGPVPALVNMWVPLQDCGTDCPSLEIVNLAIDELMPVVEAGDNIYASMGAEIAAETVHRLIEPTDLWHGCCSAGDFLLFKGTTVHRTYITPAMTSERISADIRLI